MIAGSGDQGDAYTQATGESEMIEAEERSVVTILGAQVGLGREEALIREYEGVGDELPSFIRETFLLQADDGSAWRIMTIWNSRDELEAYRASTDTPEGVRIFRSVGAEPTLKIFEVVAHAAR